MDVCTSRALETPLTYLDRKLAGICTRPGCDSPCCEDSLLCELHRIAANERVKICLSTKRAERRKSGMCAECGLVRCVTYRCMLCALRVKGVIDPVAACG